MALQVRTVVVEDPGDLLARVAEPRGVAWVRYGEGLVGWGEALRVDLGVGFTRFERATEALTDLVDGARVDDGVSQPGSGLVAFAAFTFDERSAGSIMVVPAVVLGRREGRAWVTVVGDGGVPELDVQEVASPGRVRYAGAAMPELSWLEAVDTAVRALGAGELEKVVLARDLLVWTEAELDARALTRRLAERFEACWTFAVDGLVGATPELLVRRLGEEVGSLVLAGSAPRGEDPVADASLGEALLASGKDLNEHRPAVASVTEALTSLGADITADAEPWLLRLANIQHLATGVRGWLTRPAGVLELVAALHPTAAVCGTPRGQALERIRELETFDRGRYAGPVGWFDARGDGEFGIALRCAQLDGHRARLYAGAGIVSGSLPETELEETRLKLRAMQSAFA